MKSAMTYCPHCQAPDAVKIQWGPSITEGKKTVTVITYPCIKCNKLYSFDEMIEEEKENKERRRKLKEDWDKEDKGEQSA